MQAAIHGDKAIIAAEKAFAAAVRGSGKAGSGPHDPRRETITQNTGNLVVASFRHETSRALDPELHTHACHEHDTARGWSMEALKERLN